MSVLYIANSSSVPSSYGVQYATAIFQNGSSGGFYDIILSGSGFPYNVFPDSDFYGVSSLNWEGCTINGTALRNCTAACQDPSLVFAATSTLQNCMVLSTLNSTTNLNENTLGLLSNYSIEVAHTDFHNFHNTIQDCFMAYCSANSNCSNPYFGDFKAKDQELLPSIYSTSDYYTCYDINSDISDPYSGSFYSNSCYINVCTNVTSTLNSDVGGIGVYVSYLTQYAIALIAFTLLKIWDSWIYYTCLISYYTLWPLGWIWPFGLNSLKRRAEHIQVWTQRLLPSLESALVEFQKAQCFFMLAVQIAAQIAIRNGSLGSDNLQGLYNNYALIGNLSITGFLPITFILLCLHTAGMRSWFVTGLSTCTVIASAVTLFAIGNFNISPRDQNHLAAQRINMTECGNFDPTTYCLDFANVGDVASFDSYGSGGVLLLFSLFILVFIILDQFKILRYQFFKRITEQLSKTLKASLVKLRNQDKYGISQRYFCLDENNIGILIHLAVNILYFSIWVLYLVFFGTFLTNFVYDTQSEQILPEWGFGQIVAITVWAAPLFEYLKLVTQGLVKGLDYRIPSGHALVKTTADPAAPSTRWTPPTIPGNKSRESESRTAESRENLLMHETVPQIKPLDFTTQ